MLAKLDKYTLINIIERINEDVLEVDKLCEAHNRKVQKNREVKEKTDEQNERCRHVMLSGTRMGAFCNQESPCIFHSHHKLDCRETIAMLKNQEIFSKILNFLSWAKTYPEDQPDYGDRIYEAVAGIVTELQTQKIIK